MPENKPKRNETPTNHIRTQDINTSINLNQPSSDVEENQTY